jgi:hypothetical protein
MDNTRAFLRHTLATVAYRGGKAVRGAPASFATFASGEPPKTPAQILAHIGDLYDWALSIAQGAQKWNNSTPLPWDDEVERFFGTVKRLDDYLASDAPIDSTRSVCSGRDCRSLTHIGRSHCCGGWPGARSKARTTIRLTSRPGASARTRRRPAASSEPIPINAKRAKTAKSFDQRSLRSSRSLRYRRVARGISKS